MQGSPFSSVIFRGRSNAGVLVLLGLYSGDGLMQGSSFSSVIFRGRLMRGSSFSSVIFRGPHSPRLYSGTV